MSDIAELGLRVDSRQVRQADSDLDDFNSTATKTSKKVDLLTSALKLMAAAFAALKLVKLIEETALLNARFETMGVVMNVAGNNAGYTSAQMSELEKELQKTGISMIKARENLTSLATANIDLSKATKLARAAQDLAVVGNVNSSEAFSRLTQGIKSGEVEILRTLGLNVNFENSYKKLASQLGTTSDKLTEQQKVQARTNATLEAASRYTGIYEESMGTAGKQIQSLSRYIEDAKVKAGDLFNDSLTNIVGRLTEALKAANAELDKMGSDGSIDRTGQNLAKVVDLISKSILTLGGVLAWLYQRITTRIGEGAAYFQTFFTTIMKGLNALARAVNGLFENGWGNSKTVLKGLSDAYEEVKKGVQQTLDVSDGAEAQYEAQDAALGAYVDKLWKQVDATKAVTQEEEEMRKRKEAQRIAAGVAARAEEEAEAKAAAAREAAAKALKKLQEEAASFYKSTSEKAKDQIAVLQAELNGTRELTAAEKTRIEVLNELDRVGKGLKKGQADKIKADQDAIVWLDNLNEAIKKNKKAREEQIAAAQKDIDAAIDTTRALQDQITYYGMTTDAVLRLQAAEMDRDIAQAQFKGDEIEVERLQLLQKETIKQADLQLKLNRMKAATDFWTGLESAAHQTFLSISNGNKDLWTRLKDTAKNVFFEWLYQQTLKKWIINVQGQFTAGATSGIVGSAVSSLAGGGVAGSIGSAAGIAGVLGSVGSIATGALQTAGALLTGQIAVGQTLSAGLAALTSGSAAGAVAGLSSLAGTLGPIALGIAGGVALLNKAFGRGPKEVTSTAITGTLTPTSASASTVDQWKKKGGWFSSSKTGQDTTPFSADQNAALATTYKAILDMSKVLGDTLGANTAALSTRVQQLNIDLTGLKDATAQQEAIVKFFAGVADTISTELVPNLAQFQKEGEALSTTLQRVATDYALVDAAMSSIGKSFGAVGVSSIAAREALIAYAGGADAFANQISYFQQNFLTDAQRLAPVQKQVSEALAAMNQSGLQTVEQFSAAALAIDTSTDAGAKLFAQMLALAPSFKLVADAREAEAKAAADAAAVIAKAQADALAAEVAAREQAAAALAATNQEYQDQINQITAARQGEAAVRELEIRGMDASTIALYDRLKALQAEDLATQAAAEAAQELASINSTYDKQIQQLLAARQGEEAVRKLEIQGMDASTVARYDYLNALKAEDKALADQKAAAEALAKTNSGYQQQIDQLLAARQGEAAIRALEIAGMDASTVALYDRLAALKAEDAAIAASAKLNQDIAAAWAANYEKQQQEAAQKATQLAADRAGMELELYNLTHTAAEQLAHSRELELAAMDASLRPLQEQIYAQQDLAAAAEAAAEAVKAAAEKAAAVAAEAAGIQKDMLTLQGDTAALRKLELAALDPANRAAKQAYYDLQDKLAAQEKQNAFMNSIADGLANTMSKAAEAAKQLQDSLTALMTGGLSPLSNQIKYEAAAAAFARANPGDASGYSSAGNSLLEASQSLYGKGSFEYARDFAGFVNGLQGGIASQSAIASGAGLGSFFNSLTDMFRDSRESGNDEVVTAVTGLTSSITPVLNRIATSTGTQAELTDQVTQGGRAQRVVGV